MVQGGIFLRKMLLGIEDSVKTRIETAVGGSAMNPRLVAEVVMNDCRSFDTVWAGSALMRGMGLRSEVSHPSDKNKGVRRMGTIIFGNRYGNKYSAADSGLRFPRSENPDLGHPSVSGWWRLIRVGFRSEVSHSFAKNHGRGPVRGDPRAGE
jgi:hypothetical protein